MAQITSKNLKTWKKRCVRWACKIARERDGRCIFCGRANGKLDAAHIIPRSRGWRYATDPVNIITLCARCHRLGDPCWHSDETWGRQRLQEVHPERAKYVQDLYYPTSRISVQEVKVTVENLKQAAEGLRIELPR